MENEELKDSRDAGRLDEPQSSRASKRGLLVAIIALVVIIVAGLFAYNAFSSARSQAASSSSAEVKSEWAEPSGTGPMLVDYDAIVYTESGMPFAFSEIADGKPLVVNYWATWCPYCVQEMPDYLEIYRDYNGRVSFAFVDCADGKRETVGKAAAWLADNGFAELPAYYDVESEAQYLYRVTSLPTTVVVSASGEVMTVSPGTIDPDTLRSALDSLL